MWALRLNLSLFGSHTRVGWLGSAFALLLAASSSLAATPDEIAASIKSGSTYLKQRFRGGLPRADAEHGAGPAALVGMALLAAGTPPDDPAIKTITSAVRQASYTETRTYQLALCLVFLDRLGDRADLPVIQMLGVRLLAGQNGQGGWGYRCTAGVPPADERRLRAVQGPLPSQKPAPPQKEEVKPPVAGRLHPEIEAYGRGLLDSRDRGDIWDDNSNTQFAILGVWVARKHGLPADACLDRIEQRFLTTQDAQTGGWPYSGLVGGPGSPSMTCAGLLGLATGVGRREERRLTAVPVRKPAPPLKDLPPPPVGKSDPFFDPPPKPAPDPPRAKPQADPLPPDPASGVVRTAWAGLGRVLAEEDRKRASGMRPFDRSIDHGYGDLYFLWSLARVAVVYDVETVAGVNWYGLGAEAIVRAQNPDGSWGKGRYGPDVDTAFALLFLTRADVIHDLTTFVRAAPGIAELRGQGRPNRAELPPASAQPPPMAATEPPSRPPVGLPKPPPPATDLPKPPLSATTPTKPSPAPAPETDTAAKLATGLADLPAADWPKYLARARDAKGGDFTRALVLLVHKVDGTRKTDARAALAERLSRMTAETLRGMMTGDDAELRRAAVLAAAMKDDKAHVPDLIARLTDDEEIVSRAASVGLKSLTGQDFGPPPGASREDRKAAAEAWRKWLAKQK